MDREWRVFWDNEAGPGWDWCIEIPGKENIMGLDEETARRVAEDHNVRLSQQTGKNHEP